MVDGIIEKAEQEGTIQRSACDEAVQGDLNDVQHEKVTGLLVELSAYNIMRLLHELQQTRLPRAFSKT